jgi:hypothetical protein
VKLATHVQIVQKSRIRGYIPPLSHSLHGVVLNLLSTRTTLPFYSNQLRLPDTIHLGLYTASRKARPHFYYEVKAHQRAQYILNPRSTLVSAFRYSSLQSTYVQG